MIYGSEAWNMLQTLEKNLTDAQKWIKINMLEFKKADKIRKDHIRKQTKLIDIIKAIKRSKLE